MTRDELLDAYVEGQRDFIGADLAGVDLAGADLAGADLTDADLAGADLTDAYLWGVTGNMREIKSMHLDGWSVAYTFDRLQIGCENHSIEEWRGFGDEAIAKMDRRALDWWRKWKDTILKIIEMSPATPTGHEVRS